MDSLRELYKVLWMAHYLMWYDMGRIRIIPPQGISSFFFTNSSLLSFKVHIKKGYDNNDIWIVETNAPSLQIASVIDSLAEKLIEMGRQYIRVHGDTTSDYIWTKLAGTSNREMPLSHSSLFGDWMATGIEEEYIPIVSTKDSIENVIMMPSFTLSFFGNNECSFGGEHPKAIKAACSYDSNYNIIIDNSINRVLAFIISLEGNVLKVVHRYYKDYDGDLVEKNANCLVLK